MFKKILIYFGYAVLITALVAYFYFSHQLERDGFEKVICNEITVNIIGSETNKFVTGSEILSLIEEEGVRVGESKLKHINPYELEQFLNSRTAIKRSSVNYYGLGRVNIKIEQRRPILRLETKNGGFYIDDSGYLFPLVKRYASNVPVVTGMIPLKVEPGYRGDLTDNNRWITGIIELGSYIDKNNEINNIIEQIDIDDNGDIYLITIIGNQEVIFGQPNDIDTKFKKLMAFYNQIAPSQGWNKYSVVNLKFKNQIVCTKREKI